MWHVHLNPMVGYNFLGLDQALATCPHPDERPADMPPHIIEYCYELDYRGNFGQLIGRFTISGDDLREVKRRFAAGESFGGTLTKS